MLSNMRYQTLKNPILSRLFTRSAFNFVSLPTLTNRQTPNAAAVVAGLGLGLQVPLTARRAVGGGHVDHTKGRRRFRGNGQVVLGVLTRGGRRGGGGEEEGQIPHGRVEARSGVFGHAPCGRGIGLGRRRGQAGVVLLGHHAAESIVVVHAAHAIVGGGGGGGGRGGIQKGMQATAAAAAAAAAVVTVTAVGRLVGKDAGFAGLESDGDALPVGGNGQRADALVEGADGLGFGAGAGAGRGGRGRSGKNVQDAIFPTEEGHLLLLRLIGGSGRGERAEGVRPLTGSREVVLRGGQRGYRRHGRLAGILYVAARYVLEK